MHKLEWDDYLSTGISVIDMDHKILLGLINQVFDVEQEDDDTKLTLILESLVDYVDEHFKREEVLMQICGYKNIEEHKAIHRQITDTVQGLFKIYQTNPSLVNIDGFQSFLAAWLPNHILNEDHQYKDTLLANKELIDMVKERI
ncbi:bacteriohemerythrin [Terasakiella sp. SH-1]|uniref:bacteriohemerythrin n=1 Tax=Terasakiella sp. SH-1 TaxID=2560057 RepID=UPI001431E4B7|nr:bacteriohemerythrin [Terasakiella sp. SH-1]